MAETKREIERKYEATAEAEQGLPDLTGVKGVTDVVDRGTVDLDAVYYDTVDQRLAAASLTLRRRTGGEDAGWHLKLPTAVTDGRDEIRAPLSAAVPSELAALVRSRVRDEPLAPVMRLRSVRHVHDLLDGSGERLAEVSVDTVTAQRLAPSGNGKGPDAAAAWSEVEVELADDGDPAFLDRVEKTLRKAGLRRSASASKLARALAETSPSRPPASRPEPAPPTTAGDHVLAYVREQIEAIVALDPAVRRDLPDAVHQMRVATRRLRSAFKTYRKILDRTVTDPIGDELKWLAGELGIARDQEVLTERLRAGLDALPVTLLLGPVRGRLRIWSAARGRGSRRRAVAVLDSARHLALLDGLDALLAAPPLRARAANDARTELPEAVLKDYERLAGRIRHALDLPPGHEKDLALHEARKAAKRARYAGEAAAGALGRPARRFAKRVKAVQSILGDHQDSVVARETLRDLAIQAHAAGETAFVWGLLHGREEARAAQREHELPHAWKRASEPRLRAALKR